MALGTRRRVRPKAARGVALVPLYRPIVSLGLDTYSANEAIDPRKTPYARNFRVDGGVGVDSRKGATLYDVPIGEVLGVVDSAAATGFTALTTVNWRAIRWIQAANGRLSSASLFIRKGANATGPVIVEVRADNAGRPGALLATSSLVESEITDAYTYVRCRFIEAPLLVATTVYHLVAYIQDNGTGQYEWATTGAAVTASESSSSGGSWVAGIKSLGFKTYVTPDEGVKGIERYYYNNTSKRTLKVIADTLYWEDESNGTNGVIKTGLNPAALYYWFDQVDDKCFYGNGLDAPRVVSTGLTDAAMAGSPGNARLGIIHKNRLFLMVGDKVIFSELADYENFPAVNFLYVPKPKSNDPIVQVIEWDDDLVFFTRRHKWILRGADLNSFVLEEAIGVEGLVSPDAITKDANYIYFVSDNGYFRWNGSKDQNLSSNRIDPDFKEISNLKAVSCGLWQNKWYIAFASEGAAVNNNVMIYDINGNAWERDNGYSFGKTCHFMGDGDHDEFLICSELIGSSYYAEQQYSDLGKPIAFEWRTKYESINSPSVKKRFKRWYPIVLGQDVPYLLDCQWDRDFLNAPRHNLKDVGAGGPRWAEFVWAEAQWGRNSVVDIKITIPGSAKWMQLRFVRTGVNNHVQIQGHTLMYRPGRPK